MKLLLLVLLCSFPKISYSIQSCDDLKTGDDSFSADRLIISYGLENLLLSKFLKCKIITECSLVEMTEYDYSFFIDTSFYTRIDKELNTCSDYFSKLGLEKVTKRMRLLSYYMFCDDHDISKSCLYMKLTKE